VSLRIHETSPADLVEAAFFRIQQTQMADVPILNPALSVEAVDFQLWQGHWLGVVITPWCMNLLLLPGSSTEWVSIGNNKRRFAGFPMGNFAFLGGDEPDLGEYQSCSLFSPMNKFSTQSDAVMTARASLLGLLTPPATPEAPLPVEKPALSRRGFLTLGNR
jgi:[NiFe] hydrogenase assembly HybE family chaperone